MRRFMTNTYTLEKKALSAKAIKKIKLGDQDKADIGEHSWKETRRFALTQDENSIKIELIEYQIIFYWSLNPYKD